jgi:outer membrane receptor protein involved in Fe transport
MKTILRLPLLVTILLTIVNLTAFAQSTIKGTIIEKSSGETIIGAAILEKGTSNGCVTDYNGKFTLKSDNSYPITLIIRFIGFNTQELIVKSANDKIKITLTENSQQLDAVEIREISISQKQKESALTIESMGVQAIKQNASADFYEGLGNLKGVDLTAASIGFKVINTRGFNSTSPVRSLQIIDGVDNQAPGLNFSLGNFLGVSELDVKKVDLIVGASSAFYGPNAFNGVISMETKDPFFFQGLNVMAKSGERNLADFSVRYAHAFKNKDSLERWAMKFNLSYLKADDWVADNYDPIYESESSAANWGGFDAINKYGDEVAFHYDSKSDSVARPGLGVFHRTGYEEKDIVDYGTENLKANVALHHKFKDNSQLIMSSSFGTGTTVYQGDNRFSLKNVLFFQNKIEYKSDKGFIRAYASHENAGDSYDAVFTALLLQNSAKSDGDWATDYAQYWTTDVAQKIKDLPGYPSPYQTSTGWETNTDSIGQFLLNHSDQIAAWHLEARQHADSAASGSGNLIKPGNRDRYVPGTAAYDSAFNSIVGKTAFSEGGSKFYDKSALYHIHGERKFSLDTVKYFKLDIRAGGNYRMYLPYSKGNLFSDTAFNINSAGDSIYNRITNQEAGIYLGLEKDFMDNKLKTSATIRADKNQNFPMVFSPAASLVYKFDINNILRLSFSSATRNPTLQDQYLYYNTGRAILLGNINGYDSLNTVESVVDYLNTQHADTLEFFNIAAIVPEKVKTFEIGFRTLISKSIYIDAGYYYSFYNDFIGYNIGVDAVLQDSVALINQEATEVYRIAANATDGVTTQGFSIGINYYFKKYVKIQGNYSWNKLNSKDSLDPIIPAFNTPEHKFNIGVTGSEIKKFGFNVNFKWIEGFLYEGSPQFTGIVPTYYLLDAQINRKVPKINAIFKLGVSNILNKKQFQVYGGPRVGRMAYVSVTIDLDKI